MYFKSLKLHFCTLGFSFVVYGSSKVYNKSEIPYLSGPIRFCRAALTAALITIDYKSTLRGHSDISSDAYNILKSELHRRSATRLRDLCYKNGGCYIKVGQHLGALDYLLPQEYVDVMKIFHREAPLSHFSEIRKVIQEDLGKDLSDMFVDFEETPLAAASLAQVHRAKLHDGTDVAIKVQHPNVRANSQTDMATMEILFKLVSYMFPEFKFNWLAEETRKNLPLELDFQHEAQNCEQALHLFSHLSFVQIPKVYKKFSSKRILTMEFCEGGFVDDAQYIMLNKINPKQVVDRIGQLYSEMIFVKGRIHCDPHPGNILIRPTSDGPKIILLDHGLYQTLTDDVRLKYCGMWNAIIAADVPSMQQYSEALGVASLYRLFACMLTARSWSAVTQGIRKTTYTIDEADAIKTNVQNYFTEISDILDSVPRELLLIFKTNDLIRGLETRLAHRDPFSTFAVMSRCCIRAVTEHEISRSNFLQRIQWRLIEYGLLARLFFMEVAYKLMNSNFIKNISIL